MRTSLAFVVVLLASACVGPADRPLLEQEQQAADPLEPSFSPLPAGTRAAATDAPTTGDADPDAAPKGAATTPTAVATPEAPTTPSASAPPSPSPEATADAASLEDPGGDVTGIRPPDWADLRVARLVRDGSTYTLTHVLGTDAPREGDGQNTMNIATFVDVDGNGAIDYEIWVNLSPDGWGTSYFNEREGTARYAADDEVDVAVVDGAVRLTFPSSHLGEAPRFRWSIASEYGPYQAIGTDAMARDYLPDDRSGRAFPE